MSSQGVFDAVKGWVGLVGGAIAITKFVLDQVESWRNRGRLHVQVIRLEHYESRYDAYEVERAKREGLVHDPTVGGKVRQALTILEFEIRNSFSTSVTVGRLEIDNWIYGDLRPVAGITERYYARGDYRAYDLHTRQPVNLADWVLLPPGGVLGRRVEVAEVAEGPELVHLRQRSSLPERDQFVLRLSSTMGTFVKAITLGESSKHQWPFSGVTCWSGSDLTPIGKSPTEPE